MPINAIFEPLSNQAESSSRTNLQYLWDSWSTQLLFLKATSAKASREIIFSIFLGLRDFHHKVSNLPGNILKEVSRWRLCRLSQVPYLPPSHSGTGGFANEKEVAQKMGAHQKPHPLLSSPAFNQQRLPKPLRKRHWIFSLYFFFFFKIYFYKAKKQAQGRPAWWLVQLQSSLCACEPALRV